MFVVRRMRRGGRGGVSELAAGRGQRAPGALLRRGHAAQRHRARRQIRLPQLPRAQPRQQNGEYIRHITKL